MTNNQIILKLVSKSDYRFLYNLLKERDSRTNISHKKMPTFNEHIDFIKSNTYSNWFIIKYKNSKAGSIYLSKQNEIGIFIKSEFQNEKIGRVAIQKIMKLTKRKRYLANINPKNKNSIHFFKKFGFNLIQQTYELYPIESGKNEKNKII